MRRRQAGSGPDVQAGGRPSVSATLPPPDLAPDPALAWIWYLAAGIAALSLAGFTVMLNSDLWFHLAAGRLILEDRAIPRVDSWSFTSAGQPWHNHEWLSDVIYHSWAQAFGVDSLVYWQWGLTVATFLLLFRILARLSGSFPWSFLLTGFAAVVAAPFFDTRPHLYSFLFYTVLLQQMLLRRSPSRALPLLFVLWINLHGGAVFGLMVLTLGLASCAVFPSLGPSPDVQLERRARRAHLLELAGIWAACLLACLVNPFGVDALLYPFKMALEADSPSRTTLTEWLPPFIPGGIHSPLYPLAIGLFAVSALALPFTGAFRKLQRSAWLGLALGALTLAMSLQSRRFIPLFAISHTLLLALPGAWLLHRPSLRRLGERRWLRIAAPLLALAAGLARLAPHPLTPRAFPLLVRMEIMPVEVLNFTEVNRLQGRVFAYLLWAGYVEHRTAGRLQVYIDPRSETVFEPQIQRRYRQVYRLQPGWESVLDAAGADYVLWPHDQEKGRRLISTLVASGRWRFLYGDSVSVMLARSDVRPPQPLAATRPSAYRSLALARREIGRDNLPDAEAFLRDALEKMPALPNACLDLVSVQMALAKREEARDTADRCHRMILGERRRRVLRELLGET